MGGRATEVFNISVSSSKPLFYSPGWVLLTEITIWGVPKMVGFPNNHGFPTKNDHFGCEMRVPPFKETPISLSREQQIIIQNEKLESLFIKWWRTPRLPPGSSFQCVCWWWISEMKRNETHLKCACIKVHCTQLWAKKTIKNGFVKLNSSSFATQSLPHKLQKSSPKNPTIFTKIFKVGASWEDSTSSNSFLEIRPSSWRVKVKVWVKVKAGTTNREPSNCS